MTILNRIRKRALPLISLLVVCTLILAPVSRSLEVKQAHAQWAVAEVGGNLITNIKTTIESTISAVSDLAQEYFQSESWMTNTFLDGLVWQLANVALEEMLKSTTKWVNSGFQGNPAFVTDIEGYLTNVTDKVVGNFIFSNAYLKNLCTPFALDIRIALDIQYQETRDFQAQCTLSQVVENMEGFFEGDFLAGGWDGWFSVTQSPQNNPYGAFLTAESELAARIAGVKEREREMLDWGKGILSMRDPNCKPSEDNPDDFDPSRCSLVTPGTVIESELNSALDTGRKRLTVADEINELVGALFGQLMKEVFTGGGGLLGLTESGSGGSGDYFDTVDNETPGSSDNADRLFSLSLETEEKYLDVVRELIDLIEDAASYKDERYGEENTCSSGNLPSSLANRLASLRTGSTTAAENIATINEFRDDYGFLNDPETPEAVLLPLYEKYDATGRLEAKSKLLALFNAFRSSGILHTTRETILLENELVQSQGGSQDTIMDEVIAFKEDVDNDCSGTSSSGG